MSDRAVAREAVSEAAGLGGLSPDQQRRLAAELFNRTWELLERSDRTPADDDRMIHAAHASRLHWEGVGTPTNLAVGEWQCSRVYSVLGRSEPALYHARRSLAICEGGGLEPFVVAEAHEAVARALAIAGDLAGSAAAEESARSVAQGIADPDDRKAFEVDIASLPR